MMIRAAIQYAHGTVKLFYKDEAYLADVLWCLSLLAVLPGFTLYAGRGRLRLFALLAMGLSGGLWTALSGQLRKRWKKLRKL